MGAGKACCSGLCARLVLDSKLEQIGHDLEAQDALVVPDFVDGLEDARADEIGDDLLRLISRPASRCCPPMRGWP